MSHRAESVSSSRTSRSFVEQELRDRLKYDQQQDREARYKKFQDEEAYRQKMEKEIVDRMLVSMEKFVDDGASDRSQNLGSDDEEQVHESRLISLPPSSTVSPSHSVRSSKKQSTPNTSYHMPQVDGNETLASGSTTTTTVEHRPTGAVPKRAHFDLPGKAGSDSFTRYRERPADDSPEEQIKRTRVGSYQTPRRSSISDDVFAKNLNPQFDFTTRQISSTPFDFNLGDKYRSQRESIGGCQ